MEIISNQSPCFSTQDHCLTKILSKHHHLYHCFILSIKGRVTWPNSTGNIVLALSVRTFYLVVWALTYSQKLWFFKHNCRLIHHLLLPYKIYGRGMWGMYFFHFCQLWAVKTTLGMWWCAISLACPNRQGLIIEFIHTRDIQMFKVKSVP